jgi:hypothetical protein
VLEPKETRSLHGEAKKVTVTSFSYAQAHLVQQQIAEMEKAEK